MDMWKKSEKRWKYCHLVDDMKQENGACQCLAALFVFV